MDYFPRHIEKKLLEYASYFKIILVVGARQVGKSTLLSHLFPDVKSLIFDPVQDLYGARRDPDLFLDLFASPLILDEVQFVPELLSALKRRVDQSEQAGQYFLTGSQNLSMLRSVAESMAGRVGILSLDGMTPAEMIGRGREKGWLEIYLEDPSALATSSLPLLTEIGSLSHFLWKGTFPGLLKAPDSIVAGFFQSYIQTYVERDVRLIENIREMAEFDRFLGLAAALTGKEINASQLGREIGISPTTARKWLDLLSYTYQWLELFPFSGNTIKRVSGKRKGYLRDTGMACYLQRIASPESLAVNPQLGAIFETWAINAIYRQFALLNMAPQIYHWRTAGGAEVDLILERDGKLYPIEIKCKTNLTKNDFNGIKAFRETYPHHQIMPALIIYAGKECYWAERDILALPWNIA